MFFRAAWMSRGDAIVRKFCPQRYNLFLFYSNSIRCLNNEHAWGATPTASEFHVLIRDDDGGSLDMHLTIRPQVGGAGALVLCGKERVERLALGAGAVGSSHGAEAFAAVRKFQKISELAITRGSMNRWFTDSRSCIDALNGQSRMYGELMRHLWDRLENIMSREVNIEAIWIPSHCWLP